MELDIEDQGKIITEVLSNLEINLLQMIDKYNETLHLIEFEVIGVTFRKVCPKLHSFSSCWKT